jgi:thiol-disulfide isomerase/thioredoxin
MHRRFRWICSTVSSFALAFVLMVTVNGCGKAPSSTTVGESHTSTDPQFAVPEGPPQEILAFANNLRSIRPQFTSQEQVFEFKDKLDRAMIKAGDKILAQDADDDALTEAVKMKVNSAIRMALEPNQPPDRSSTLAKNVLTVVTQLREDKRKAVVDAANEFFIVARSLNLKSMSSEDRTKLIDVALQRVTDSEPGRRSIGGIDFLAEQFAKEGDIESAASIFERLSAALDETPDPGLKEYAGYFRGKANRLRLPGNKIEIEGLTLDGTPLDWSSYRGKVVLVDFWATWCGPCVAELPNVRNSYDRYHSKGFEVIGISLDRDRKALESFLKKNPLPWPQLFVDPVSGSERQSQPMAQKYGISTIPAAFLVDKEGNVISMDARGTELHRLLRKQFE